MRSTIRASFMVVVVVVVAVAITFSVAAVAEEADDGQYLKTSVEPLGWCDRSRPFCNQCTACDRSLNPACGCRGQTESGFKHYYCNNYCEWSWCNQFRPVCNECTACDRSGNPACVCKEQPELGFKHYHCKNFCKPKSIDY